MRVFIAVASLLSVSGFAFNAPTIRAGWKVVHASALSTRMAARDLPNGELRTQLIGAKKALSELLDKTNANPLMVPP